MKPSYKWIGVTLVVGAISFALTRVIWPDPAGAPHPPAGLIPFFIILSIGESLAFGLGVAFLVFGFPLLRRAAQPGWVTWAAFLSIAWYLVNWWPHDNLHRINVDFGGLLWIEYAFHVTMEVAGALLALFFFRVILSRASTRATSRS